MLLPVGLLSALDRRHVAVLGLLVFGRRVRHRNGLRHRRAGMLDEVLLLDKRLLLDERLLLQREWLLLRKRLLVGERLLVYELLMLLLLLQGDRLLLLLLEVAGINGEHGLGNRRRRIVEMAHDHGHHLLRAELVNGFLVHDRVMSPVRHHLAGHAVTVFDRDRVLGTEDHLDGTVVGGDRVRLHVVMRDRRLPNRPVVVVVQRLRRHVVVARRLHRLRAAVVRSRHVKRTVAVGVVRARVRVQGEVLRRRHLREPVVVSVDELVPIVRGLVKIGSQVVFQRGRDRRYAMVFGIRVRIDRVLDRPINAVELFVLHVGFHSGRVLNAASGLQII